MQERRAWWLICLLVALLASCEEQRTPVPAERGPTTPAKEKQARGVIENQNLAVTLDEATCTRKLQILAQCFPSQRCKQWFDDETFRALLRLRGIEANSPTRYAEAFYCRKAVWRP